MGDLFEPFRRISLGCLHANHCGAATVGLGFGGFLRDLELFIALGSTLNSAKQ
jgi:hypothetical protein